MRESSVPERLVKELLDRNLRMKFHEEKFEINWAKYKNWRIEDERKKGKDVSEFPINDLQKNKKNEEEWRGMKK